MKKKIVGLGLGVVVAFAFTACVPEKSFDSALLIGKWERTSKSGEYYRYDRGGTGATWDTSEDISEEEAQTFSWTLEKDLLTLLHNMEMDSTKKVPKYYTITALDDKTLTYKDDFKNSFTFTKK